MNDQYDEAADRLRVTQRLIDLDMVTVINSHCLLSAETSAEEISLVYNSSVAGVNIKHIALHPNTPLPVLESLWNRGISRFKKDASAATGGEDLLKIIEYIGYHAATPGAWLDRDIDYILAERKFLYARELVSFLIFSKKLSVETTRRIIEDYYEYDFALDAAMDVRLDTDYLVTHAQNGNKACRKGLLMHPPKILQDWVEQNFPDMIYAPPAWLPRLIGISSE